MPRHKIKHQTHNVYPRRVSRVVTDHTFRQRQKTYASPPAGGLAKLHQGIWQLDNSSTESLETVWSSDSEKSSLLFKERDQYNNYRHTWIPGLTHSSTAVVYASSPTIPTMSYMVQNCGGTEMPPDPYLVEWTGDIFLDFENVKLTTSAGRKLVYTTVICLAVVVVTCLSSVYSMAMPAITREFLGQDGQPPAVVMLGLTLYLLGMAVGPLVFAPMSEVYGRRVMYAFSFFCALAFNFGCAFACSLGGLLACRFLTGLFASGFVGVAAGTIGDLYDTPQEMQVASMLFTSAPVIGPAIGPMFAGSLVSGKGNNDWRWCFHVMSMALTGIYLFVALVVPETCESILLERKAARVRQVTKNNGYYTTRNRIISQRRQHLAERVPLYMQWVVPMLDLTMLVCESVQKPVHMLLHEPMLALLCGYSGLLLAVMYMFFVSYPRVFSQTYGFNSHQVGLAFGGLLCGAVLAIPTVWVNGQWVRRQQQELKKKIERYGKEDGGDCDGVDAYYEPEMQLKQSMIGSLVVPVGMLVFSWCARPGVSWVVCVIGGGIVNWGSVLTSNGIYAYTLTAWGGSRVCKKSSKVSPPDIVAASEVAAAAVSPGRVSGLRATCKKVGSVSEAGEPCFGTVANSASAANSGQAASAASAMACNGLVRSVMGSVAPLAGQQMYRGLGSAWAGTLVACFCVAYVPLPVLFYRYGRRLRAKSRYAV